MGPVKLRNRKTTFKHFIFVAVLKPIVLLVTSVYRSRQEIYRPGTAISNASNLCTAVGGDENKEFRCKTSIMRGGGEIK